MTAVISSSRRLVGGSLESEGTAVEPAADRGIRRHRIERAPVGYRVIGPHVVAWEPTLAEARAWRDELEGRTRWPTPAGAAERPKLPGGIVYGPVQSRRLGRSLGVDLTPAGCRVCTFDCVYCQWGALPRAASRGGWPDPSAIAKALELALRSALRLDSITISGHGEPTLHPHFPEVVDAVLAAAGCASTRVPVRILTNGTQLVRERVGRTLDLLDECIVKLDADALRVNRPQARDPVAACDALVLRALRRVTVQSCFIGGRETNAESASVARWVQRVRVVAPRRVQIYTIDARAGTRGIRPVAAAQLEEIACELRARTGIEARVFG